jgi:hypothetical protein
MEFAVFLRILLEILECKIKLNDIDVCLAHLDRLPIHVWLRRAIGAVCGSHS